MSEQKEEKSLIKKILWWIISSPVSVAFIIGLSYFGFQAFVLGNNPFFNKLIMCGIGIIWFLWFMLRHLFIILLILIVIGGGVYLYYSHSRQEQVACEQKGGYWNSNTKICEEKISFWQNIQKMWEQYKSQN